MIKNTGTKKKKLIGKLNISNKALVSTGRIKKNLDRENSISVGTKYSLF